MRHFYKTLMACICIIALLCPFVLAEDYTNYADELFELGLFNGTDKGYELDEAISMAMDDCIENGVLADILLKCKSEVFHMLLTEYDEKKHLKHVREEGREEGREEH